jgi:hypothetical protein
MRRTTLSAAAVALGLLALTPAPAAAQGWYVVCGNNGNYWIGVGGENYLDTGKSCGGPTLAAGRGSRFNIIVGERQQVSATGKSILSDLEMSSGALTPVARGKAAEAPTRTEVVYVRSADVGPKLSTMLTRLDPTWKSRAK